MENDQQNEGAKIENILEKIKRNELSVRPKIYFRLKFIALVLLLLAIFATSLFLLTFIIFSLRVAGDPSLIAFGARGLKLFLILFPWSLLIFDLVLISIFGYLLRSFRSGYKIPLLYFLFATFIIVTILSLIVDIVKPFHHYLLQEADERRLPLFAKMYENVRRPPPISHGIYRGRITAINGQILDVEIDNVRGIGTTTPIKVVLPNMPIVNQIKIGDHIFIAGNILNGKIITQQIEIILGMPEVTIQK